MKEENEMQYKTIKNNKTNKKFSTTETILLVIISLLIGLIIGGLLKSTNVIFKNNILSDEYLQEFIDNYEYVINNYYEEVDKESLINEAISGMMKSLDDPYSMYFNEEETDNFSITLDGSYKGLGIQILKDEESGYMIVAAIFKNSPAEKAGLMIGDKIVSVGNIKTDEISASEFSSLIRDSDESEFKMSIIRDGDELELTLQKNTITLNSVTSEIYSEEDKKIGYIYIGVFANNTYEQFKEKLEKLESEKIDALIIDVRGNTGGHLTSVDSILDLFLNSSQIMYQFEQNNNRSKIYGKGQEKKQYEIVLIGDESSASASEVLISALKENLGAKFIGKKTYGKGTVQELVTLSNGTQYKITIKKWLTPDGNWINDTKGINPDIEVEMSDKYYSTYNKEDDTQLLKALEYLKNK